MQREGFVFYRSFFEAGKNLPTELRGSFYDRLVRYGIDGDDTPDIPIVEALFSLVKPQIDANNRRFEIGSKNGVKGAEYGKLGAEYGIKGGRPKNPPIEEKEPPQNPPKNPGLTPPKEKEKEKEKDKEKDKVKEKEVLVVENKFSLPLKNERDSFFEELEKGDITSLLGKFGSIPEQTIRIESRKFLMYWTETDMRGKPRWKKQPTFDPIRRFATWIYKTCEKMEENKPKPQRVF